jgi:hypothetical protein
VHSGFDVGKVLWQHSSFISVLVAQFPISVLLRKQYGSTVHAHIRPFASR